MHSVHPKIENGDKSGLAIWSCVALQTCSKRHMTYFSIQQFDHGSCFVDELI